MSKLFIKVIIILLLILSVSPAHAWLFYSKPEFRGRVIDSETKQPMEGVVVVVLYNKWEFSGPGGGNTFPMDAREMLTDKNGDFYFPAYRTMIGPLSRSSEVSFIIFKPGYLSATRIAGIEMPDERYFTIEKSKLGREGEIEYVDRWDRTHIYKGQLGIVGLKKAKTFEERSKGTPYRPTGYTSKDLPLLFKAVNNDRKERGLEGEIK